MSPKENELLVKLYNQGLDVPDLMSHFPTMSSTRIRYRLPKLQHLLPRKRAHNLESARLREDLNHHLDGLLDLEEVRAKYPHFSRDKIYHGLKYMRMKRSETGPDRST